MAYSDIFQKEISLIAKLGEEKAHISWVMAKYLQEPDVESLAAIALTDGTGDKKIDFIYLDLDERRLGADMDTLISVFGTEISIIQLEFRGDVNGNLLVAAPRRRSLWGFSVTRYRLL